MKECTTHHHACDCREAMMKQAISDAVARPKGIVPDSAAGLYDQNVEPEQFHCIPDCLDYDTGLALEFARHGLDGIFCVWLAQKAWLYNLSNAGKRGADAGRRLKCIEDIGGGNHHAS